MRPRCLWTALVCLALPLAAARAEEAAPPGAEAVKAASAEAAKPAGTEAAKPAGAEAAKPAGAEGAKPASVEAGRKVAIEYTLSFDGGKKESNVGGEPLVFEHGAHQILPALEEALAGMKVSETRKVTLPPDRGYGEVMPQLIQEVDPQMIPEEARVAGAELAAEDAEGNRRFARVQEVREDKILVDLNHPLAGKTLTFDIKILSID